MLDEDLSRSEDDFVDIFLIKIPTTLSQSTNATFFMGQKGYGKIALKWRLRCTENHYGSNCATFCMERDDELGHYTCDSEGDIVCREGYQDPATNCTQCVPAEGCCKLVY